MVPIVVRMGGSTGKGPEGTLRYRCKGLMWHLCVWAWCGVEIVERRKPRLALSTCGDPTHR